MTEQAMTGRPGDYGQQARTYDLTRGASPTLVRAIGKLLGSVDERRLLDIAGGTGNYARAFAARGFGVLVVDAEPEMLAHAARKLGPGRCVAGDAQALPFRDGAADCAIIVNATHLFEDLAAAFREARRVVRDGPVVVTAFTQENLRSLFVYEYFGLSAPLTPRPPADHFQELFTKAGFRTVRSEAYVYTDSADGSLNALHTNAMHLAGPAYLRNTSFWHRLDEHARRLGLDALARDLRSGVLEERVKESFKLATEVGHGTLFAAWP